MRIRFLDGPTRTRAGGSWTLFFRSRRHLWRVFMPIILWHAPIQLIAAASFGPTIAALIIAGSVPGAIVPSPSIGPGHARLWRASSAQLSSFLLML